MGNPPKGKLPASVPTSSPNRPNPDFIQHGTNDSQRRDYPNLIKPHSPIYWCWDGTWGQKTQAVPTGEVCLVEVWEASGKVTIHPSRHEFFGVLGATDKRIWHELAVGPYTALARKNRAGNVAQHITPGPPTTSSRDFHKDHRIPPWALQQSAADELIGYTSENRISWSNGRGTTKNINAPRPSVYYKHGHLTTEHDEALNMGWSTESGKCLFFGNVLTKYVRKFL